MTTQDHINKILTAPDLSLEEQRDIIKRQSYSDAFPGSKEARSADEYAAALEIFDADHPEIKADIIARRKADDEAKTKQIGNPWERGL